MGARGQPGFHLRNSPRKVDAPAKGQFHKTHSQITCYRLALSPDEQEASSPVRLAWMLAHLALLKPSLSLFECFSEVPSSPLEETFPTYAAGTTQLNDSQLHYFRLLGLCPYPCRGTVSVTQGSITVHLLRKRLNAACLPGQRPGTAFQLLGTAPGRSRYTLGLSIDPEFPKVPARSHFCFVPDVITDALSLRVPQSSPSFDRPRWHEEIRRVCSAAPGRRDRDRAEKLITDIARAPGFRLARRQVGRLLARFRSEWKRLRSENDPMPPSPTFLPYVRMLPKRKKGE